MLMDDPDHGGVWPAGGGGFFTRPIPQGVGDNAPGVVRNNVHRALVHQLNFQTENEAGFEPVVKTFNGYHVAARRQ